MSLNMQQPEETVGATTSSGGERKYKGIRRRRWGKWVSEIRVPGTRERLWLGSYSNPEAAAVAHDTAVFFLRGPGPADGFNFPDRLGRFSWAGLSPRSVQKVASDSGMAVDAELAIQKSNELAIQKSNEKDQVAGARTAEELGCGPWGWGSGCEDSISFDDIDFYLM